MIEASIESLFMSGKREKEGSWWISAQKWNNHCRRADESEESVK